MTCLNITAQVGVGTTTPQGALEISSTTNGVLIPRVALTSKIVAAPVVNPQGGPLATSTLVWNTATAGVIPNNVIPGFYYWNGAAWVALTGIATNDWSITGNGGTTAGTNYVGTTDAQDIRFKTNGTDKFNIGNTSNQFTSFNLGSAAAPTYSWNPDTNTGVFSPLADNVAVSTNGTEKMRVNAAGQVAIGTTTPQGAIDITSTTNGILIPRVALTSRIVPAPVVNPQGGGLAAGTLVYNTATAGTGANIVTPGYYFWRTKWRRITDMVINTYIYPPFDVAPGFTYTLTGTFPEGESYDAATVSIPGDWPAFPDIYIDLVETRTGSVRFRVTNYSATTTYTAMDFAITTFKY